MSTNVVSCKRKDIPHLHQMNDYEFIYWLLNEDTYWTPRAHMKLDGAFIRFGKDSNGDFFFQTARSDVLFDPQQVVWHSLSKGYTGESLDRASKISAMFKTIVDSQMFVDLPKDISLECEMFYVPLAEDDGKNYTFVTLPYSKKYFTQDLTLYVHRISTASTGEETEIQLPDADIPLRKSRFPQLTALNLSHYQEYVSLIGQERIMSLNSRKHADRKMKLQTKELVATLKAALSKYILSMYPQKTLGAYTEGVVLHINNKQFKVISDDYWRIRNEAV